MGNPTVIFLKQNSNRGKNKESSKPPTKRDEIEKDIIGMGGEEGGVGGVFTWCVATQFSLKTSGKCYQWRM